MSSRTLASSRSERGEVVLRRREYDGALELRVNGVFVMDDRETSTERLLARATLDALATARPTAARRQRDSGWRVVVGGLGLGFTLTEVLSEPRVGSVVVAEIEETVVAWHRDGLLPHTPLEDGRVDLEVDDVRNVMGRLPASSVDLVLLDVDNGPDFLVYEQNAAVYASPFLSACRDVLAPDGLLAVWSSDSSPTLIATLDTVFGSSQDLVLPVTLQTRATTYHLFLARRHRPPGRGVCLGFYAGG